MAFDDGDDGHCYCVAVPLIQSFAAADGHFDKGTVVVAVVDGVDHSWNRWTFVVDVLVIIEKIPSPKHSHQIGHAAAEAVVHS